MQNQEGVGKDWPTKEVRETTQSEQVRCDSQNVPLQSLSELTGFPVDFIKKELLLDGENVSMGELRALMTKYLEATAVELEVE